MNNLHRELAPVSDAAWEQIEEEATRTLKRFLAARRVVDVTDPQGAALSAVGTGHVAYLDGPCAGVSAVKRQVLPVVEFRVPFKLTRQAIDDVERGSQDSDWSPLKEAAKLRLQRTRQFLMATWRQVLLGFDHSRVIHL